MWRSCPHMALSAPWACRKTHRVYQDTSSTADTHIPELPQGVNKKCKSYNIYFFVNENMWYTVAVDGWVLILWSVWKYVAGLHFQISIKLITDGIYYKTQWLKVSHAIRKPKWMVLSTVLPFFSVSLSSKALVQAIQSQI